MLWSLQGFYSPLPKKSFTCQILPQKFLLTALYGFWFAPALIESSDKVISKHHAVHCLYFKVKRLQTTARLLWRDGKAAVSKKFHVLVQAYLLIQKKMPLKWMQVSSQNESYEIDTSNSFVSQLSCSCFCIAKNNILVPFHAEAWHEWHCCDLVIPSSTNKKKTVATLLYNAGLL